MLQREISIKAELGSFSESELDQFAESVARKLMQLIPGLDSSINKKQDEPPIKMRDICRLLHISDTTARSWMSKGTLPFHRKGNRVFFFKTEVLKSLEQPLRRA